MSGKALYYNPNTGEYQTEPEPGVEYEFRPIDTTPTDTASVMNALSQPKTSGQQPQ